MVPLTDGSMMKTQFCYCIILTNTANCIIGLFQKELMNGEFT